MPYKPENKSMVAITAYRSSKTQKYLVNVKLAENVKRAQPVEEALKNLTNVK